MRIFFLALLMLSFESFAMQPPLGDQPSKLPDNALIREKRLEERDKRLRPEGANQYIRAAEKLEYSETDPFKPSSKRDPLIKHAQFVMIGGGFAGLSVAANLRTIGIDDFYIIDEGGDFGGVWYWNRFPGAMCDTAAMIYLPFLEETGYMPSSKYVSGSEIYQHARRIGEHYHLYEKALFSTHVNRLIWDQNESSWIVETNRGDRITAKYIAIGTGPLSQPKLPGIPGIEKFAGKSFHTSRWDYDYTGGGPEACMTNLRNKRVGIIGTGATAVQCIPPLGRDAQELFVFQRTPSAINEHKNEKIDPIWYQNLEKGWQRKWLLNFAAQNNFAIMDEDLVKDNWTEIFQRIYRRSIELQDGAISITPETLFAGYQSTDDEKMEELRARVSSTVTNSRTANDLKAWYRQLCKRPCFHDEYLPTFNLPNVHLIDTNGKGVTNIDASGVWVDETHYEIDCLIYASGFMPQTNFTHRCGFEIIGREGLTLAKKWANGMESYQGMHVRGFPNMFIIGMTQGANLFTNITGNYTEAALTLSAILKYAEKNSVREVEASHEAESAWVKAIEDNSSGVWADSECTPGFWNNEGRPVGRYEKLYGLGYPLGPFMFFHYIDKWRKSGEFKGLEFHRMPKL